uniref:Si:ch211-201h21.5 n=1 Tax=Hippocampus comes TaxID=109280 RepID=A0A3Q2Y269_HIPCM
MFKLLVIDTDCGIDDAQAILVALAAPHVRVLAATCVFGNASVDDVCQNVLRVLAVGQREQIPVFRGSAGPLLGTAGTDTPCDHFGTDGLGDVFKDKDPQWEAKIRREHAVSAMVRLVAENPAQVSICGPLWRSVIGMKRKRGLAITGDTGGKGNVSLCAEFNFAMDPEAAYVVLEEFLCPTYMATWEYACRNALSWVRCEDLTSQDTAASRFMKTATSRCWAYSQEALSKKRGLHFGAGFVSFDSYAVAACVDAGVVAESVRCPVRVELQGAMCRGMMVLDRVGRLKKQHSVTVFTKCNKDRLARLLLESLRQPPGSPDAGK